MSWSVVVLCLSCVAFGIAVGTVLVALVAATRIDSLTDAVDMLRSQVAEISDDGEEDDEVFALSEPIYALVKAMLHAKSCSPCGRECKSGECPGQKHFGFDEEHSE